MPRRSSDPGESVGSPDHPSAHGRTAVRAALARVIAGRDDGRETWRQLRALNQLGVTRGTLQLV